MAEILFSFDVCLSVCLHVRSGQVNQTSLQESRAVARKPRDAAAVLFGLKFADNIHYKFKSSQASKAIGAKQNLTQNNHSRSFKITCFGISGKAIRDLILNTNVGLQTLSTHDVTSHS